MKKALMTTLVLPIAMLFVLHTQVVAASPEAGALTDDLLVKLRSGYKLDHKDQAIYNALSANDINTLAVNHDRLITHNPIFNKEIKTGDITNQEASGRCWMFAGLNRLRPAVMNKLNLGTFKMSTNYLFFWDKLEKANTFLESIIITANRDINDRELVILLEDPCPDGGWWSYVVDLVDKYGVVPEPVMPETYASANTGSFNSILGRKLRKDAAQLRTMHQSGKTLAELRAEKEKMLADIFKIEAMNLGEPPQKFNWRYASKDSVVAPVKEYTPQQFYQEMIGYPLSDFICIFNYPGQDYFRLFRLEESRNLFDKGNVTFINLPIDSLKRYALTSVLSEEPVWFACDVGKANHRGKGILDANIYDFNSIYGVDVGLTKEERIKYRDSSPNHAMVLTGVDTANGIAVKWKVENSWGTKNGDNGWWTMYDDWFNEYVYVVIVDRKHLPKEVAAILETKPTLLPAWDPMWDFVHGVK